MVYDNQIMIRRSTDVSEGVTSTPLKHVVHNNVRRAEALCVRRMQAATCPTDVKCIHEVLVHIPPKMMAAQLANAAFHSASGGTKSFVYICL